MTSGRVQDISGYARLTEQLARQALSVAADAPPHRAPQGERRWPMANALPAARVLLGDPVEQDKQALLDAAAQLGETLADPAGRVTDGFGHARPAYAWLALHLLNTAARVTGDEQIVACVGQVVADATQRSSEPTDPRLSIWRALLAREHGIAVPSVLLAEMPMHGSEAPAPLVTLGRDDLLDAWTYRELVGLHGLYQYALLTDERTAVARVESAALYHLGHTQPDYTTYQPWALAAFASHPQTALFAEQQLHDVATHLRLEGPGGAVLPALLLADAAATMSGRSIRAWQEAGQGGS